MKREDIMAKSAKYDKASRELFIQNYEKFILKCASKSCRRYVTKSDDEWSIALIAFSQAIDEYADFRGSFLHFAELVISRRLSDYFRSNIKYSAELPVSPSVFDSEPDEEDEDTAMKLAVSKKLVTAQSDIKSEIDSLSEVLKEYGFSFYELTSCSPKAEKTKQACFKAVNYILDDPVSLSLLRGAKQLPIKILQKDLKLPRKIFERHRKYIIAATEILSGEYPELADYMQAVKKGGRN